MSKSLSIGIISLGWLGETLSQHLMKEGFEVWGTVRCEKKLKRIQESGVDVLFWDSREAFSPELKAKLKETDYLVLNLPPSAFSEQSYASGLGSFYAYLGDSTKVIFTSSTSVYPNNLADATEDYIFEAGQTNKMVEAEKVLVQQMNERLCILRLAGLIGEDRNPVYHLAKKEINTDPDKKVNLIHRQDILKIISIVLDKDHFGEIFNVCHPEHPSRKRYYNRQAQEFNLPEILFEETTRNPTNKIVNCTKLQEVLNYRDFEML